jgi:hypothetical protein
MIMMRPEVPIGDFQCMHHGGMQRIDGTSQRWLYAIELHAKIPGNGCGKPLPQALYCFGIFCCTGCLYPLAGNELRLSMGVNLYSVGKEATHQKSILIQRADTGFSTG